MNTLFTTLTVLVFSFSNTWAQGPCANDDIACENLSLVGNIEYSKLPVVFSSFDSSISESTVKLLWSTSSETNNLGFEIQSGSDPSTWEKIGFIDGNGTTETRHDYSFIDDRPRAERNYYRLKQIDFDKRFNYSKVLPPLREDFKDYEEYSKETAEFSSALIGTGVSVLTVVLSRGKLLVPLMFTSAGVSAALSSAIFSDYKKEAATSGAVGALTTYIVYLATLVLRAFSAL